MTSQPVLVQGAGSWGTALALVLARNHHQVYLWDIDLDVIREIKSDRYNRKYLPGIKIPANILPIEKIEEIPIEVKKIISAVPCRALRSSLNLFKSFSIKSICIASKGFEPDTHALSHKVVEDEVKDCSIAVLSGPSFAAEVATGLPTAVTIAAKDIKISQDFSNLFHTDFFRVYIDSDYIGVQIAGAVKNVMAIAAGISDGLSLGSNARSALITRGLAEITRLGLSMGAKQNTFMGLAGLGDLILTCTDDQSRNRRLGLLLAEGLSIEEARKEIGQEIEGLNTAKEVGVLAKENKVEMPISEQVINVITSQCSAKEAAQNLVSREKR